MEIFKVMFFLFLGSFSSISLAVIDDNHIKNQCSVTRYPQLCIDSLKGLSSDDPDTDFIHALVNKTISETNLIPSSYFAKFTSSLETQETNHANFIIDYCQDLMNMSIQRLENSALALKKSRQEHKEDIQTWISAAMTFQQACKDSADSFGLSMGHISEKMEYLSQLGSNSLALISKVDNINVTSRKRDNLPGWMTVRHRKLLQATPIKANAVVAKDGSGNYQTISEAISAASGGGFVIYVKAGVYNEKIKINKDGITLIGDGKYSTIITGDDSVGRGSSMPGSATFTITGDGFIARDIGFQNTAGPNGQQALAIYVSSDHAVFFRCSFVGYQDTLYALALRQFYRECDIYGTVDFIFGNAAAVFQNCLMSFRRPRQGSDYNVIMAHGRTDPGQSTGFSLQNCRIAAGSDFSPVKSNFGCFLGRAWKEYSRAVVMESTIDDVIKSPGWVQWPGTGSTELKNLYFAEYQNSGAGAGTSGRVNWPGYHVIGADEAVKFTVGNFIAGTSWLPATGVTFVSGLQ